MNWDAMIKREGRNHGKGPVHIYVWSAMLKRIAANTTLSQQEKTILHSFTESHKGIDSLKRDVPFCTVEQQYGKPNISVTVHVRAPEQAAWNVIKAFLERHGGHDLPGTAPRGPIFKSLADELDSLSL